MKSIKIGTRNSPLAMWQAEKVAALLKGLNIETEIVPVLSTGDKNLTQPLYAMGISGVFTKDLDVSLLNKDIDIAVHSLKDIPTQLPENVSILAVLERDFPEDVLVRKNSAENIPLKNLKIATSSLRRRAFWAKEFPETEFSDIRGNVQTRLQKLENSIFDATLFSLAAIERMKLGIPYEKLPIMLSAPAQGVVAVCGRTDDAETRDVLAKINHRKTAVCTEIEREFLRALEGGCTAPIGAFAEFGEGNNIRFQGKLCSLDGKDCISIDDIFQWSPAENFGEKFAQEMLAKGGKEIMAEIKNQMAEKSAE